MDNKIEYDSKNKWFITLSIILSLITTLTLGSFTKNIL